MTEIELPILIFQVVSILKLQTQKEKIRNRINNILEKQTTDT